MKRATMLLVLAAFSLAACAPQIPPDQQAFLHELADRPITCAPGADCAKKWARAIEWVKENPATFVFLGEENFAITKLTKTTIQTNQARIVAERQQTYPGYRVTKYPREDGTYGMDFHTVCEQIRCKPSALELKASFVTFVMGLPEGVTSPESGVFQKTITH